MQSICTVEGVWVRRADIIPESVVKTGRQTCDDVPGQVPLDEYRFTLCNGRQLFCFGYPLMDKPATESV